MKFIGVVFLIFSFSSVQAMGLDRVSFLLGCWENSEGAEVTTENWTKISESRLQRCGRTGRNGQVVFWENLEISLETGAIVYHPAPLGKPSVSFAYEDRSTSSVKTAAFVNMTHDFPQQIIYSVSTPDALDVELKGVDANSKSVESRFSMKRVGCAGEPSR